MGWGENVGFRRKFWVGVKILGSGENFENFRLGRNFLLWAKILGWGENFGFRRKFWVGVKILVSGENFELR